MRLRNLLTLSSALVAMSLTAQTTSEQGSAINASWPGGLLTFTLTSSYVEDGINNETYSNYVWKDPQGGIHSFAGTSSVRYIPYYNPPTPDGERSISYNPRYIYVKSISTDGQWTIEGYGEYVTIRRLHSVYPKFQVLSVYYAPPGPASSISYANSTMASSKTSISKSYSNTVSISANFGLFGTKVGMTQDWTWSTEDTKTTTVQSTINNGYNVKNASLGGPTINLTNKYLTNPNFINHDNDIILVWLNPKINISQSSSDKIDFANDLNPYSVNDVYANPVNGIPTSADIVALQVGWLNGHIPWPNDDLRRRCCRTWDTSYTGDSDLDSSALSSPLTAEQISRPRSLFYTLADGTQPDIDALLAYDPWISNPNGNNAFNAAPGRYILAQTNVPFAPYSYISANTSIALSDQRTNENQTTKSSAQSFQISASYSLFGQVSGEVKDKWTWTSKSVQTATQQKLRTDAVSVFNPVSIDSKNNFVDVPYYSGINVYQDSFFGTFLFTYPDNSAIDPYQALALQNCWNDSPSQFEYSTRVANYYIGTAIEPNVPSINAKPVSNYTIFPALPSGLSMDPLTGIITGTPIANIYTGNNIYTKTSIFTVTASNNFGNCNTKIVITIR